MTKVKVQDATKQLSTNAGMLFETVSRARKQAQDTYGALKKISDDLNRTEKQRLEMEAKEALRKQYEAAATYMTGYSTEQVSEIQEAASRAEKERARRGGSRQGRGSGEGGAGRQGCGRGESGAGRTGGENRASSARRGRRAAPGRFAGATASGGPARAV